MPDENKTLSKGLDALLGQQKLNQRTVKEININKIKAGRFTFTREDIVKQSVSDNVGIPSNVLDFVRENPLQAEARPTFETIPSGIVNIDVIRAAETDAYKEMFEDQQAWDEEFSKTVSYTHLRAQETLSYIVCRLLL